MSSLNNLLNIILIFLLTISISVLIREVLSFQFPELSTSKLWKYIIPNDVKIVGGRTAMQGEFPYHTLIKSYQSKQVFMCGGTIISEHFILTAAHCVFGMDYFLIQVGGGGSKNYQPGVSALLYVTPNQVIIHENYNQRFVQNDIAIIHIKFSLTHIPGVRTVSLPKLSQSNGRTFDNYRATVSGWGKTADEDKIGPTYLQTTRLTVMSHLECQIYYGRIYYEIRNDQICTAYHESGTCNGDSGGGLIIEETGGRGIFSRMNNVNTIIGIVSFGTTYCEIGSPSVFTNVAAFLPWIHKHTGILIRH